MDELPIELQYHIIDSLNHRDLSSLCETNQNFQEVCSDPRTIIRSYIDRSERSLLKTRADYQIGDRYSNYQRWVNMMSNKLNERPRHYRFAYFTRLIKSADVGELLWDRITPDDYTSIKSFDQEDRLRQMSVRTYLLMFGQLRPLTKDEHRLLLPYTQYSWRQNQDDEDKLFALIENTPSLQDAYRL